MSVSKQQFQFHDIAIIKTHCPDPYTRDFFDAEYNYHSVSPDAGTVGNGLPSVSLKFKLDYIRPPGFTTRIHKALAYWNYDIKIEPGSIHIDVHGNQFAIPMVHHMLVHPSLRWLATQKNSILLHAGAVTKNGKSLIFTGTGGAGKTTTTSLILDSDPNWCLHADDYVFLQPGPNSLAYVTRSHLYRNLLHWVPQVSRRLTLRERIELDIFGAIRQFSKEQIKWPVRLDLTHLWERPISATATPAALLLLERADLQSPRLAPVKDLNQARDAILEMNFSEARHFISLLRDAKKMEDQWLSNWKLAEKSLLDVIIHQCSIFRLVLPYKQTRHEVNTSLLPLLNDLVA